MVDNSISFTSAFTAASLAVLVSIGAGAAQAGEPETEQCLDPAICPIPYVRLAKQETEPFLFIGKVVDENHPWANDYRKALRRFPDVRSCLTTDEREKPQPDLRQIDWMAISSIREIDVCIFRIASSIEDVEIVKLWLEYHGFTVGKGTRIRHGSYVPKSKTDRVFSLEPRLSMDKFRKIIQRWWLTRMIGLEIGRSYALYIYFSQGGQVVGVTSSLSTKLDK